MKKLLMAIVVAVGILGVSATAAPSQTEAATWTVIGSDYVRFPYTGWGQNSVLGGVNKSTGGSIRISVPYAPVAFKAGTSPVMEIQVWEDDGNDVLDDYITTIYHHAPLSSAGGTKYYHVNVDNFVDGVNKRAEIYLKYGGNYRTTVTTKIWD